MFVHSNSVVSNHTTNGTLFNSIDAVDEEHHMVYFSGNAPTALNERHAYVASYQPTATAR